VQWFTPVIPATPEVEIKRMEVRPSPFERGVGDLA
jgi:hypothetical protein